MTITPASGPHDLVAIGFGPSGLALAVAFDDLGPAADLVFLERGETFAWHEAMLIEGARLQVSCLKDLATLRDPCSPFTFLSYLRAVGRLDEFVNLGDMRPTRVEFNDYLRWAAERVSAPVRYGREVVAIEPEPGDDGETELVRVTARVGGDGGTEAYLARNVVVATGGIPRIPPELAGMRRIFHSSTFLRRIAADFPERDGPWRFLVVGEGQSGAEIFDHMATRYPHARVTASLRGIAYRPMDETPFVNEIFFPRWVDFFHALPEAERRAVHRTIRNTNYGVVDLELIEHIYRRMYQARVTGDTRMEMLPLTEVDAVEEMGDGLRVVLRGVLDGARTVLEDVDAVVLATGYDHPARHPLLEGLRPHLRTDDTGRYDVGRGYRIAAAPGFHPGIFLQGQCSETHGISDALLSVISTRADEVRRELVPLLGRDRAARPERLRVAIARA